MGAPAALGASSGVGALAEIGGAIAAQQQANRNARLTRLAGGINAREARRQGRRLAGAAEAAAGASGVDPTSGSALEVSLFNLGEGEREAIRTQFGFDSAADAQQAQGGAALVSGVGRAGNTLLTAATRFAAGERRAEIADIASRLASERVALGNAPLTGSLETDFRIFPDLPPSAR